MVDRCGHELLLLVARAGHVLTATVSFLGFLPASLLLVSIRGSASSTSSLVTVSDIS